MKKYLPLIIFGLFLGQAYAQTNYNYLGSFSTDGKPKYLDGTDQVSSTLLSNITASLPEGYPVPTYNPSYISSGTDTDVRLSDSADVWVVFVKEGAGYKNVLGYYTYDVNNPPSSAPAEKDITIIFPNVSAKGSGGSLEVGHRVKIGTFPKNTGIGWVLIANGFSSSKVTNGNWVLNSNPDWNPESKASERFHNVLLTDTANGLVVLGFEDIRRDYSSCDNDFNDAIFYVRSNPITAIQTQNMNTITQSTSGVSSGSTGGLESNACLANQLSQRTFKRKSKNFAPSQFVNESNTFRQANPSTANKKGGAETLNLRSVIPTETSFSEENYESSPVDLNDITNAKQVVSVDYYKSDFIKGVVLATETQQHIYDHTKAICDRLNGAELLEVTTANINGYEFVRSTIKNKDGQIEYAISLSLLFQEQKAILESFWNLTEYHQADEIYNFQVWTSTPTYTHELVHRIITAIESKLPIEQITTPTLPKTYVKKARYFNSAIEAVFVKTSETTEEVSMESYIRETETGQQVFREQTVVSVEEDKWVDLGLGSVFDADINFKINNVQQDALYQADGAWGLDFQTALTEIQDFSIQPKSVSTTDGYQLEREVQVSGYTSDYLTLFRLLKPGGSACDLSMFNSLNIDFSSSANLKASLIIDGKPWQEFPTFKIGKENAQISLKDIDTEDLKRVVGVSLTASGDGSSNEWIEMEVKVVEFSKDVITKSNGTLLTGASISPNPNTGSFRLITDFYDEPMDVQITNVLGEEIFHQQYAKNSQPEISIQTIENGIYFAVIKTSTKQEIVKFIKK